MWVLSHEKYHSHYSMDVFHSFWVNIIIMIYDGVGTVMITLFIAQNYLVFSNVTHFHLFTNNPLLPNCSPPHVPPPMLTTHNPPYCNIMGIFSPSLSLSYWFDNCGNSCSCKCTNSCRVSNQSQGIGSICS